MFKAVSLVTALSVLVLVSAFAGAQTFSAHPTAPPSSSRPPAAKRSKAQGPTQGKSLGWGSNIKVARRAKAAEMALKRGQYALAMNYAQGAADAAPQDSHLWFLLGFTSRMAGKLQNSVAAYQRGLQIDASAVEGLSGLAQTYMKMGRPNDAKPLLMRVIAGNPKRPNELEIAGELFMQTGDYQEALNLLQRAEGLKPTPRSELLLAMTYVRLKQPAKAKALLEKARKRSPNNPEVLRAVASFYRDTGDYAGAITTLKAIPHPAPAIVGELAYTYQLAGQTQEAAKAYSRAADADPKHLGRQLSAAQAQLNIGSIDKAKKYLQRAAAIDPNHYRLHALRGEIATAAGDRDAAIKEFEAALATMPEVPSEGALYPIHVRVNLFGLYNDADRGKDAEHQLSLARAGIETLHMNGNPNFLRLRGQIRVASQDLAGAETDFKQALALTPKDPELLTLFAGTLWKLGRKDEASNLFKQALALNPTDRSALFALGSLAREAGDVPGAENYFDALAKAYPKDFRPYLALGDMYASRREFEPAQAAYYKGHRLAPENALIVAGGANAAIEHKRFELAKEWLDRAHGSMNDVPQVMRERERYLTWTGKYREAAQLGYKVIEKLPRDRDAVVYLGYSLLYLGRFDDLLRLTSRYEPIMPREANLPLLAGYVLKSGELLQQAVDKFSQTIALDPKITTAYVNRGYLYNELQDPDAALQDFSSALTLQPKNAEARLGIANADLELHRYRSALEQVDLAAKLVGETENTHLVRASAYRGQGLFSKSEVEYLELAKLRPDDPTVSVALGNVYFRLGKFRESLASFQSALSQSPDDPFLYAKIATDYAALGDREQTLRYLKAAERANESNSSVLLAAGNALLEVGDEKSAQDYFLRALEAPDADRVQVRLSFARLMLRRGEFAEAHEQIGLAFAEARIGEANYVTPDHLLQAAGLLVKMRDFDLAEKMFERARKGGAGEEVVNLGLANLYVAQGKPQMAEAALATLGGDPAFADSRDYMLVQGEIYRQRRENQRALVAFAHARADSGDDDTAQRAMLDLSGPEGLPVTSKLSLGSDAGLNGLFEQPTDYVLDSKELQRVDRLDPSVLVPTRSSIETHWALDYRLHQNGFPPITGFVQYRNAQGDISVPVLDRIIHRNTTDYAVAGGLNPVLRMGNANISFNGGVQFTLRRDKDLPFFIDQNLVRPYLYVNSNTLFGWLSFSGFASYENGPFTERLVSPNQHLSSRDAVGKLDFRVGQPWGRNALVTGYFARDLQFDPLLRERFTTSSYIGWEHTFGSNLKVRGLAEYIRAWRVRDNFFVDAKALRPAMSFEYERSWRWKFQGSLAYSRGSEIHAYDNIHTEFLMTYTHSHSRPLQGADGAAVEYPLRFSVGLQEEQFFGAPGGTAIVPVVRLSIF